MSPRKGGWRSRASLAKLDGDELSGEFGGEFRARRHCAEQETLGSQSLKFPMWRKGVTAMVKNVFSLVRYVSPTAPAILGWLSFVFGLWVVKPFAQKLALMSAARVLP